MSSQFPATPRTTVRRLPDRGSHDKALVFSILDEGFLCHVSLQAEGQPMILPTLYTRSGDVLYLHGSSASRMIRELGTSVPVAVAVTLVDGFVLARSAFHHSMNYRSVVILGRAEIVQTEQEKLEALRLFTDSMVRERWSELRPPKPNELKATTVLRLPLEEASAKVRTGPPHDDDEDLQDPAWAGVVPLDLAFGTPMPDQHVPQNADLFDVRRLLRNRG